jgi:hypothetical protein
LKKLSAVAVVCGLLMIAGSAYGQQFDVAFGLGGLSAPSTTSTTPNGVSVSQGGGVYPSFSGDFLFHKNFGLGGEISWRATQAHYAGLATVPYRPIFYDVDAVYGHNFGKVAPQLLAGIGAESLRFYQPYIQCGAFGCTNYNSSNHFMGVIGGGLSLYVRGHLFVRPEVRAYLIRHNVEFNSNHAIRYGASIGYTFGGSNP